MQRIIGWLGQGWRDFRATQGVSMVASTLYTLLGMALIWGLTSQGKWLLAYPFASGFLLVAPVLLVGFQRAAWRLRQGVKPTVRELMVGVVDGPAGIWFLTFILLLCYLIWVTDALVIYAIYFDAQSGDSGVATYLLFSGVMGLFFATLGFIASAFSVSLILHRQMHFVAAVLSSVRSVFRHAGLMLGWGITLVLLTVLGLLLLPLMVVIMPVLAYASYAAFIDLYPQPEAGASSPPDGR